MPWAADTIVGRHHVPLVRVLAPPGELVHIVEEPLVAIEGSIPIWRRVYLVNGVRPFLHLPLIKHSFKARAHFEIDHLVFYLPKDSFIDHVLILCFFFQCH